MKRFYVKEITALGTGKKPSTIRFKDGVNIIYGPSNTGKSYAIACINFMFGASEIPFSANDTGYDQVVMVLESTTGDSICVERGIYEGSKGEIGESKVQVSSTYDAIESREYNITNLEYSDMLLKLIGIEERHKIISSQKCDSQNLTNRSVFHMFFIDEDYIFRKGTVIDAPKHSKITASITALNFLLTGKDFHELAVEEKKVISDAKRTAVIYYINSKIQDLSNKRGQLESALAENRDIDVDGKIEIIIEEMTEIEGEIIEASENSRQMLEEIYSISSRLEEAAFLRDRYKALRSQYMSDVKRLEFIIEGEEKGTDFKRASKCPFCDSNMPHDDQKHQSYIHASKAELERINLQLQDLQNAEQDVVVEIDGLECHMNQLNIKNYEISELVDKKLRPRAAELKMTLHSYKRVESIRQEMAVMDSMSIGLSADAFEIENEENSEDKYDAKKFFNSELFKIWSDEFSVAVKECGYPNYSVASISRDSFDAVVNGKQKRNEGKGYRAFLNTVMAFNLMKFLEKHGKYAPKMLFLDSPILSLKERGVEQATDGMKTSLFRYLISNSGNCQVIIAENEIPTAIDYSSVNLIEFTMDDEGRYGFLNDVKNNV